MGDGLFGVAGRAALQRSPDCDSGERVAVATSVGHSPFDTHLSYHFTAKRERGGFMLLIKSSVDY